MSVSVTMYRSEKFEANDILSRDIRMPSVVGDKYLMDYSDKRISESIMDAQDGMESSGIGVKVDSDFSDTEESVSNAVRTERDSRDNKCSSDSNSGETTKQKQNLQQTRNRMRQEHSNNSENEATVRKTSFSVSDILDPQKFIGSNGGRTPVWHPWLREDVVQDYSKTNLDREEKLKGSY